MSEQEDYLTSLRSDAAKSAGVAALLDEHFLDAESDDFSRRRAAGKIALIEGALWHASIILVDELFQDLLAMDAADSDWDAGDSAAFSGLPDRYMDRYRSGFARRFIASAIVVTSRVAAIWFPPATVAEEIALRLLLDRVEMMNELHDLNLDSGWRGALEDLLFEDVDHEYLYDESAPLEAEFLPAGAAPLTFDAWFTPFRSPPHSAPYATDDAS